MFAIEAKMKQIELVLEFGETIDRTGAHMLKADNVRLGQIVTNLLSNAIRFTASSDVRRITARYDVAFSPPAEGSCLPPVQGHVSVPSPGGIPAWLFVSVRDTGPGLGLEEQAALFQRFSRESVSVARLISRGEQDDTYQVWRFGPWLVHLQE
jgi:signal transduction histidine kinase